MKTRTIKVGVIPAAGEGKRLGYLSSIIPKCLFPLYDKPIIHHAIENMIRVGIRKVIIPMYYQKDRMIEYFDRSMKDIDIDIHLLDLEKLPRGIALTIASAKEYLDEPFLVILGDDVTISDSLQPLVDLFFKTEAIALEGVVPERNRDVIRRTCCIELKKNKQISKIVEKPVKPMSNIRGCGVYIFDAKIFEYIKKTPMSPPRHEAEITNAIGLVAKDGKAYGEFINGVNINVNTPEDLFQAWLETRRFMKRE
jgi:glucose-1-phosphate thymidylyltransferase/bifunctional UDP-N-acetylglucosamine pyrophosphorylase/glucosamine-1-phosphate N-acetyltransferase